MAHFVEKTWPLTQALKPMLKPFFGWRDAVPERLSDPEDGFLFRFSFFVSKRFFLFPRTFVGKTGRRGVGSFSDDKIAVR